MNSFKRFIISLVLIGTVAGPAFAAGEGGASSLQNNTLLMTTPSGAIVQKMVMDQAMADMMVKDAMPMTAGVIHMMHGGKMYMVTDKKMPDGKMLSEFMMTK